MSSGIVLVDKPAGISSAAVVATVKRRLELDKAGHAGTLDPMATGLLVCLTGSSTRLATYAEHGHKIYSGSIRLGLTTDTDDITGQVLTESRDIPPASAVIERSRDFVGRIEQTPPRVSAIKVNGRRSYELAREGKDAELKPRTVEVFSLAIEPRSANEFHFVIECTRGTYIRSIARDLGVALGCGGCLASLRREASQPFEVSEARPLDQITREDLRSWCDLFPDALRIPVESHSAQRLHSGDLRALAGLVEELRRRSDYAALPDRAIYLDGVSQEARGLLVREDGQWRFAVNVEGVTK